MASVKDQLTTLFAQAFETLGYDRAYGEVALSDRPDLAHFQCNGALACAKAQKKNPRELAQAIVDHVKPLTDGILLTLAGPGFINLILGDEKLADSVNPLTRDPRLGVAPVSIPQTVVIDYGGPNVAKAMHMGHLRSPIIGDSLMRLHRFMGNRPIGDNHLGDWGTPMGMLIATLAEQSPELPYFDPAFLGDYPGSSPVTIEDLERIYPKASQRFKEDPAFEKAALRATDELQKGRRGYKALWQHFVDTTIRELERDFGALGIQFDHWLGESFYERLMPPLVERLKSLGVTEVSEGALVIPVATPDEPERPPVILVKSGGGFLYHTSDLATVEYRVQHFKADLILYVVDKRQSLHFRQVFEAAKKSGLSGQATLIHTAFGTMNGKDGKPFKTRDGGTIKLKDVIEMVNVEARKRLKELGAEYSATEMESIARAVGIATLKFADLKNNRTADYIFDLERFAQFEGHTGPYLMYSAVRIKSILRKAQTQGLTAGAILAARAHAEGVSERKLMLELIRLPDILARALENSEPHHLADFGFNLSQAFNFFYKECHILSEPDSKRQASWLSLCALTHDQLVLCLDLLGISVPEKM